MRALRVALFLCVAASAAAPGQSLPFAPGERLTYQAKVGKLGTIGRATMGVDGPVDVRGLPAWHLRFAIDSKIGFIRVLNVSESWIDALHMTSLRFHKVERHPLSKREERVDVFPAEQRWRNAAGDTGHTPSAAPLDELSFIYFLRTVALPDGGSSRYDRHFEAARNPTLVSVQGRETLTTPAGTFETVIVEMRVRDGRYGEKGGAVRVHFSDDARRLPVRIESAVPMAGRAVLTLESYAAGDACRGAPIATRGTADGDRPGC